MRVSGRRFSFVASALCWVLSGSLAWPQMAPVPVSSVRFWAPAEREVVVIDVLAWNGELPSRVAIRGSASREASIHEIDPSILRAARVTHLPSKSKGLRSAEVQWLDPDGASRTLAVAYQQHDGRIEGWISDPASATALLEFDAIAPEEGGDAVVSRGFGQAVTLIILILTACWGNQKLQTDNCRQKAIDQCGEGNVQCSSYTGTCGLGGTCDNGCWTDSGACMQS